MNPRAVWLFIAGDSRFGPLLAALAIVAALLLVRLGPAAGPYAGGVFFALISLALVVSVFEPVS